jgi:hypothetical protein
MVAITMLSNEKWRKAFAPYASNFEAITPVQYGVYPGRVMNSFKSFEYKVTVFFALNMFVPEIVDTYFNDFLNPAKGKKFPTSFFKPAHIPEEAFLKREDMTLKGLQDHFKGNSILRSVPHTHPSYEI